MSSLYDSLQEFSNQAKAADKAGDFKRAALLFKQASDASRQIAESLRTSETRKQYLDISNQLMVCAQKCNEKALRPEAAAPQKKSDAPEDKQGNVKRDESETDWVPKSVNSKGFCDVAGLDYVKDAAQLLIIDSLKHKDLAERWNVRSEGILMYGLPGTGKTTVAEAIAVEANAALFHVSCSDIDSKWVGESARNVKNLFAAVKTWEPAIIFFDDCEGLCTKRDASNNVTSAKVVTELLRQIDDVLKDKNSRVLILYATNQPWSLDSAVLSRTRSKIFIPLPDAPARESILMKGFRELSTDEKNAGNGFKLLPMDDDVNLKIISYTLENYGGRDIMNLCQTVRLRVFGREVQNRKEGKNAVAERITLKDIEYAMSIVKPGVTETDEINLEKFMMENDPDARA